MNENTALVPAQEQGLSVALSAGKAAESKARSLVPYEMGRMFPRNKAQVRISALQIAGDPAFANLPGALYALPRGGKRIEGLGVRCAEMLLGEMGNMEVDVQVVSDDPSKRIIRTTATDYERNVRISEETVIEKIVERRRPQRGEEVLSSRQNSSGETVYTVQASDDDTRMKAANAYARAKRNCILALVPSWIKAEVEAAVRNARMGQVRAHPELARRAVCDAFSGIGVEPVDLERLLKHPIGQCSPKEIEYLRGVYGSIKTGECSFVDVLREEGVEDQAPAEKILEAAARNKEGPKDGHREPDGG